MAADLAAPNEMPVEDKTPDKLLGFFFFSRYATDYNFRSISQSNRQGSTHEVVGQHLGRLAVSE